MQVAPPLIAGTLDGVAHRGTRTLASAVAAVVLAAVLAACSSGSATLTEASFDSAAEPVAAPTTAAPAPVVTTSTTAAPAGEAVAPPTTTSTIPERLRRVTDTGFQPFALVGGFVLSHPAARVERVGFHESNHDGAQQMDAVSTAAVPTVLEARDRGTLPRTAADVVVDPAGEIRSPVSGTVKRGGTYTLYCKYTDSFLVIAPDERPDFEVKLLHISGLRVSKGQRVEAGQTVVARRSTQLPFESQVDELRTADPAWPHVHIEVVDPAVKDRPTPGGGCP